MDLGEESSKYIIEEAIAEKMDATLEKMTPVDANKDENREINGEMGFEDNSNPDRNPIFAIERIGSPSSEPKVKGNGIGDMPRGELTPKSIGSSSNSNLEVNSTPTKGYGLKKWRRIRRDLNKDASGGDDVSSLARKKKHSLNELFTAREDNKVKNVVEGDNETPTPSVGSLRSIESVEAVALDPKLVKLVASGGFSIGMDSENNEDQSSKPSTATTVPRPRHEIGFVRERGRSKNIGGRGIGSAMQQRARRGRGSGVDVNKKIRGDRVRLEKENLQSSIESDLISSNVGFMRWGSGVSNGKCSEKSLDFDRENGDEAQTCEEIRSGYHKENGVAEDFDPDLSEEGNTVKRQNFRQLSDIDPFVESIVMLQAAQEALETEIQKFGEIGEATEQDDVDNQSGQTKVSSSPTLETHSLELNQKVGRLERRLEEALATIKAKESKIRELEDIVIRNAQDVPILEDVRDLEFELENLLKKKIQAEVEFLIIARTTQKWKMHPEDQMSLLEEQTQTMLKISDAENKVIKLKEQAEKLESNCKELIETGKALKMQNKVCKFSFCCFIQLLLMGVAFGLFWIQLPTPDEFAPT